MKELRTRQITVRMTPMERKLIENYAKSSCQSTGRYMVLSSIRREFKVLPEEQRIALKDLSLYHTNFSRISNLMKDRKDILKDLEEVIRDIKKTIEKIENGQ